MLAPLIFLLTVFSFFITTNVSAHSQVQIIEITSQGFSPSEITVDENSTIIFVNKDNQPHWPASDFHPTHEIYPEFDPGREIEPGQSWPLKPIKVGAWKFHDHLFPHIKGIITVIAEDLTSVANSTTEKKDNITFIEKIKIFFGNL